MFADLCMPLFVLLEGDLWLFVVACVWCDMRLLVGYMALLAAV